MARNCRSKRQAAKWDRFVQGGRVHADTPRPMRDRILAVEHRGPTPEEIRRFPELFESDAVKLQRRVAYAAKLEAAERLRPAVTAYHA